MTRLFLLTIVALLTWSYFPETRAMLMDVAEPIVLPIMRWSASEEMSQVARNVVEYERLTGQLPAGRGWLEWLDYRYSMDDIKRDPWGSVYQMEASTDSVWIVSFGPDRVRGSDDDFRVASPRG